MATKTENESYSKKDLVRVITSLKHENVMGHTGNVTWIKWDKVNDLEKKVLDVLAKTDVSCSKLEILLYALCETLQKSGTRESVSDYWVSIAVVNSVFVDYVRAYYPSKAEFLTAPLNEARGPICSSGGKSFDAFFHSPEYAIMHKLFKNMSENLKMQAREYVKRFGSLSQSESIPLLYRNFADSISYIWDKRITANALFDWLEQDSATP